MIHLFLTLQERRVILFILFTALIGLGMNFLSKHYSQIKIISYLNQDAGKINLNQATKEVLMGVPGIGKTLSQRIIYYRREKSKFNSIEELKEIKGISEYKYGQIKDYFILE